MIATQSYTVPIIAGDLRRVELVTQFADTFDYLDSISQDIFNRIAIRLNIYRAQLNKFDELIQHTNAHIDRIKGSTRAIQVHSSARYPVEQNRSTYKSIFECDADNEEHKSPVLHYNSFRLNETVDKFIDPNDKESKSNDDTLIVLKQYENNFIQKTNSDVLTGLGKPPANIRSVVSFLKYKTKENPYIQSTTIDPLNVSQRKPKQVEEPLQPRISEMPVPAVYERMYKLPIVDDSSYKPSSGLAPEFILRDNLFEPGNYATFDDNTGIDWTKQQMASIAPSYAISMLPDINDLPSTTTTAPVVETPTPTVPALPPVDIPFVPPPAPLEPPPGPQLPADERQVSVDNKPVVQGGDNSLLAPNPNAERTNQHEAPPKPVPFREVPKQIPQGEGDFMDNLRRLLEQRRPFIIGSKSDDDSDDDN